MHSLSAAAISVPSALTTLLNSNPKNNNEQYSVALQVQHNLQYQHQWNSLTLHTSCDLRVAGGQLQSQTLARPILSGLPPTRLYIHPDEMIAHVSLERKREKDKLKHLESIQRGEFKIDRKTAENTTEPDGSYQDHMCNLNTDAIESAIDIPQREWVIPTRTHERWTLNRLAAIFDKIENVPPEPDGEEKVAGPVSNWPRSKRVILAIVGDDSTVVYYIVHEGLIKPRQN